MAGGTFIACPRCHATRQFMNRGLTWTCVGCEWRFTLSTQAPTGTNTAAVGSPPGSVVTIPVASGGASFTAGMQLVYDTAGNAEVVVVGGGATATSIPVPAGFARTHAANATFGQLAIASTWPQLDLAPALPGWGF